MGDAETGPMQTGNPAPQEAQPADSFPVEVVEALAQALEDAQVAGEAGPTSRRQGRMARQSRLRPSRMMPQAECWLLTFYSKSFISS